MNVSFSRAAQKLRIVPRLSVAIKTIVVGMCKQKILERARELESGCQVIKVNRPRKYEKGLNKNVRWCNATKANKCALIALGNVEKIRNPDKSVRCQ